MGHLTREKLAGVNVQGRGPHSTSLPPLLDRQNQKGCGRAAA